LYINGRGQDGGRNKGIDLFWLDFNDGEKENLTNLKGRKRKNG